MVSKFIVARFPVFLASGLRYGLAAVIFLVILYAREDGFPKLTRQDVLRLFLLALTGVFGFSVCLLYGIKLTTAAASGIIASTGPMVIALLSFLFLKERLRRQQWLGITLAILGMAAIRMPSESPQAIPQGVSVWVGDLLIFCAVIGESMFTILGKVLSARLSPLAISTYVTVFGFLMFLPFAIYQSLSFHFRAPSVADWMYIVYYAVVVTVIGLTLWYSGVSVVPASTAGAFTGVIAISALLLSYVFLQEPLKWDYLAGGVFVLIGVYVTTCRLSDGADDLRTAKASAPPSSSVDRGE